MSEEKMLEEFNKLAKEFGYDLTRGYSQEYSYQTTQNVWKLWQASAAHSAARISELEGQVAMLRDVVVKVEKVFYLIPHEHIDPEYRWQLVDALLKCGYGDTTQTAEEYRKRVQAEALEEAAVNHETWHGFDKHGTSEFLRYIASELRDPSAPAEGKGEK